MQTVEPWHRPEELAHAVVARHGQYSGDQTGSACERCDRWKWLPVSEKDEPIVGSALASTADVIASPETFGDGLMSFRHVLFRRQLGETLVAASQRNWKLVEVQIS